MLLFVFHGSDYLHLSAGTPTAVQCFGYSGFEGQRDWLDHVGRALTTTQRDVHMYLEGSESLLLSTERQPLAEAPQTDEVCAGIFGRETEIWERRGTG